MSRKIPPLSGQEPELGGRHSLRQTGMEPALSREFGPLYGRFRLEGLEAPPVEGRRRPLVVLADYDDSTAELAHLLADSNGYEVRRTDNGREAWGLVRALEPNMLVVNIRLPGINGLDLIQRVRSAVEETVSRTPILIMDARYGRQALLAAFKSGADDYLEMPYEVPVMLRCWHRVVKGPLRPPPLTALLNEDAMIRQVALSYLLEARPSGLEVGLGELLWQPDPVIRSAAQWALRWLGTEEALAVLERTRNVWQADETSAPPPIIS